MHDLRSSIYIDLNRVDRMLQVADVDSRLNRLRLQFHVLVHQPYVPLIFLPEDRIMQPVDIHENDCVHLFLTNYPILFVHFDPIIWVLSPMIGHISRYILPQDLLEWFYQL